MAETWRLADQTPGTGVQITDWPAWEAVKLLAGPNFPRLAGKPQGRAASA
ncbi:hypothetical protein HGP14_21530 [Rhizobium sp. P32RR-XVIII]|nr:hypothetical protein [Rhizobium sp. P32RR-XVIII]NLS05936.1 hypothetical protein [Rhizobium sp. P32RR-XVIII]